MQSFSCRLPSSAPTPRAARRAHHPSFTAHHSAFTLVELLVAIAIIGMLAGLTLGALQWGRRAAAEAKTKSTIAKLDAIVMEKYESYFTRRVPFDFSKLAAVYPPPTYTKKDLYRLAAVLRIQMIQDLMRMEMPERYFDITCDPLLVGAPNAVEWTQRPSMSQAFVQKYNNERTTRPTNEFWKDNASAECLYLWISMSNPEVMEQFRQDEIGDTDNDGWPEFLDGWGMPIRFLRWAPGYCSGDGLRWNYFGVDTNPKDNKPDNPLIPRQDLSDIQSGNPLKDHDPFDSRNALPNFDTLLGLMDSKYPDSYRPLNYQLFPLIYSAGPDKKYGINVGDEYFYGMTQSNPHFSFFNPYNLPDTAKPLVLVGSATDTDGANAHIDNITNHRNETP
jgi:prepilin-type N-terminal cleavage/methylation domain-containing protein